MNCNDVRENLIELLASEPPGVAAPEVREHMGRCSACAQEYESLRQTMLLLDEWQAPEPSPYFMTRLQAHVKEEQAKSSSRGWQWLRRPALAVSLATVLVIGGVTYTVIGPPREVAQAGVNAVKDLESIEKNHDLYVNSDLLDEVAGLNQVQDTSE